MHFTELTETVIARAEKQLKTQAIKNLALYYGRHGLDGILSLLQSYLIMINNPVTLQQINQNIAFRSRYSQMLSEEGIKELPYLHYKNDKFYFGDWRRVKGDDDLIIRRKKVDFPK